MGVLGGLIGLMGGCQPMRLRDPEFVGEVLLDGLTCKQSNEGVLGGIHVAGFLSESVGVAWDLNHFLCPRAFCV